MTTTDKKQVGLLPLIKKDWKMLTVFSVLFYFCGPYGQTTQAIAHGSLEEGLYAITAHMFWIGLITVTYSAVLFWRFKVMDQFIIEIINTLPEKWYKRLEAFLNKIDGTENKEKDAGDPQKS